MNIGRYEIESYRVTLENGILESRQRIIYTNNNGEPSFSERYYGYIRPGYQQATSFFSGLKWDQIRTHVVGESISIVDQTEDKNPLIYLDIANIDSIEKQNKTTIRVIDTQIEPITLEFISELECNRGYSTLNYIIDNPDANLNVLTLDTQAPTIFFNNYFQGAAIYKNNSKDVGFWSSADGDIFECSPSLSSFVFGKITKSNLLSLIFDVSDNRDSSIIISEKNLIILNENDKEMDEIIDSGNYKIRFNIKDISGNTPTAYINFIVKK